MTRFTHLLLILPLLSGVHSRAAKSQSVTLSVNVRPAVSLTMTGASTVGLKIRLAPQTQATLWRDDECGAAAKEFVVSQSGTYDIPLSQLGDRGAKVCVASSDGALRASVKAVF